MSKNSAEFGYVTLLLVSVSMMAVTSARAQSKTNDPAPTTQPPNTKPKVAVEDKGPEVVVVTGGRPIGGGLMKRQTSPEATYSITAAAIAKKLSAASPLQLTASMPGVNFGNSNAYGLAIRNFLSVRGLDETEMGFVVDGMPATDQSLNFPYAETWADPENIADLTLIAGTTRLEDPNETASGGELIETVRDPSDHYGGTIDYSAGSFKGQRAFVRLDAGYLGNSGIKAYTSYSYTAANNFIGAGRSHKGHVDFKAVKEWGTKGKTSLFISYTNWFESRLNTFNLANWETANAAGDGYQAYNYGLTYKQGITNYWKSSAYTTQRVMMSVQNAFQLTPRLSLHATPYFHWIFANGGGLSTLNLNSLYNGNQKVTINPANVSVYGNGNFQANTNQTQWEYAAGINTYLQYDVTKTNNLTVGYWYDHWNMDQLNGVVALNKKGDPANLSGRYVLRTTSGGFLTGTRYQDSTQINAVYLSDTQSFLGGRLKINGGFKELMDYISGTDQVPGPLYHFSSALEAPLPRVYISYDVNPHIQVYVNGTTNTKPPIPINAYPNDYSTATGKITQAGNTSLKPEYTIGEEVGFRYHGMFNFDLALFNMNLTNHQVNSSQNQNGLLVQEAISVGGETIRGMTAEIALHPMHGFEPYANIQYLHTRIDNDIAAGADYLRTAGKTMVESPPVIGNIGLNYSHGPFFGVLNFKWVDSQYSTFINDQSMPAYKTVDLSLGYHFPAIGFAQNPTIRVNMTNLSDVPYLGTIAGPQTNAIATKGIFGKTVAGSAPTYYISAPFAVMATISTDF